MTDKKRRAGYPQDGKSRDKSRDRQGGNRKDGDRSRVGHTQDMRRADHMQDKSRAGAERITFAPDHADDARRLASSPVVPLRDVFDLPLPELLLPAGSPDSLSAAIEAGADAVYFGASAFSARARAVNFTEAQITDALRLCRAFGVKAYAAVNTRIRESELDEAIDLVGLLLSEGTDAIITADLGLCAKIREKYPEAELHASTQLTPTSVHDALALRDLGFSRMVAPREITAKGLFRLCGESSIEIEAFIHGAHCVSLSGQCLMSSMIGARSANRGECAQPCRMCYKIGTTEGYLLSLADMCYAGDIPAIISTGVRSLKIEGRQKDADYVCGVGKIYRKLLDERRSATEDEIAYLASLFGRGFTDGYLRRDFAGMCGVRESDATREKSFAGLRRTVPLDAKLTVKAGEVPTLRITTERGFAEASLERITEEAEGDALTYDRAKAAVSKLGGTPFVLRDFEFDTDGKTWLAASDLNSLRRAAVDRLTAPTTGKGRGAGMIAANMTDEATVFARSGGKGSPDKATVSEYDADKPKKTAEFTALSQIPDSAWEYFDVIYLPRGEYEAAKDAGHRVSLTLPPYTTDESLDSLAGLIGIGERVLCHTVGQIAWARSLGATADASFRLNVWNSRTLAELSQVCNAVTVSPELPLGAMRGMDRPFAAVVYGKIPVMYTVKCMMREALCRGNGYGGDCGKVRENAPCRTYMTDRTGASFFILGGRDCTNTVYNSVPIWNADKKTDFETEHYIFSDESKEQATETIEAYRNGESPKIPVRRIK